MFFEEGEGHVGNLLGFGQAPGSGVGARQPSHCWLHHRVAVLAEGGDIVLDEAVVPHLGVHGGGEEHRAGGHEEGGGEHVVGGPGGDTGEEVRSGGDDDHEVCGGADGDVPHLGDAGENAGGCGLPGEGFQGGGADEIFGCGGGDGGDGVPGFGELANDHAGFVGGNAAADAHHNVLPCLCHNAYSRLLAACLLGCCVFVRSQLPFVGGRWQTCQYADTRFGPCSMED